MQLHTLKPIQKNKKRKRVGRGGKRGTYSGRGQKGQKSRSGRKLPGGALDVIKNIPKLRGIKNRSIAKKPRVLGVCVLEQIKEERVTKAELVEHGLIKSSESVKILSNGEIIRAVTIAGISVSKGAKEKIEKAGGSVEKL
jgi:large subunit ribosomal protein L15